MISYYELLGMIKEDKAPKGIRVYLTREPRVYEAEYDDGDFNYYWLSKNSVEDGDYKCYLAECFLESSMFEKNIEIIEEGKELHANEIVFNFDNNKRECVITLDENDLGIDELHIDNCYFYKENDKWYVREYDFKTFNIEEEKKIPEKIRWHEVNGVGEEDDAFYVDVNGKSQYVDSEYDSWGMTTILKINEILDYLKSKGE